ncbi:MAG: hypothetical protein ACK53L_18570 [Pirellulaceae bacterium]
MDFGSPWPWLLWLGAVLAAVACLIRQARILRSKLQAKLSEYVSGQSAAIQHKHQLLAEFRRRAELTRKILAERQAQEARMAEAAAPEQR